MLMTGYTVNKFKSWLLVSYGLGSKNQICPGFITMGGDSTFRQAAFLPGIYQGCNVNYSSTAPLSEVLADVGGGFRTPKRQRHQIDLAKEMNECMR